MQTLEALERAIATSYKLKDVVRTMKVLAAASIRQYEQAVLAVADYGRTVELGLKACLRRLMPPTVSQGTGGQAAIVFGSDHGLCGRFNEVVADFAVQHLAAGSRLLAVGARIDLALQARGWFAEESFFAPGSVAGITFTVRQMLEKIENWRGEGVERVDLFYQRHSGQRLKPLVRRLLPLQAEELAELKRSPWPGRSLPDFSLEATELMAALVRQYLFISLYRACAEAQAAEYSQRLLAMQLAERNIDQRIEELTRTYHQLRQEKITAELLEIVSGFEAVHGE